MPVLFCSDTFWQERGDEIEAIDPKIEVVQLVGDDLVTEDDLERITIAYFSGDTWPDRAGRFLGACTRAPNLEWLQTFSAGTDEPIFTRIRDAGAVVTNSAGSSAPSIAQTVIMYLLALSRDLPRLARAQTERRWDPGSAQDLDGLRLGIVGMGEIGSEVARLAIPFGMDVVGVRRAVRGDEICETWPNERLDELLERSDAVVVAAPLTDHTRGLFDDSTFARMPPGAWFVNVGRGEIVDETALASALSSGHLGGAGLDVFATEPLPADSPLWALPNVIITPHTSGTTDRSRHRSVDQFVENFRRWSCGETLRNVTSADD
ncbi:D-2-hydroxyacid dehydrogenase [Ilumatobacter sp.]|uniref:D-2-hydroxyacid dehydrogenase n=1 Tax=Ilumatobacter sp. TaxID=1967498 RepID=UPI003AF85285